MQVQSSSSPSHSNSTASSRMGSIPRWRTRGMVSSRLSWQGRTGSSSSSGSIRPGPPFHGYAVSSSSSALSAPALVPATLPSSYHYDDMLKMLVLLCILTLVSVTVHILPQLQHVLDRVDHAGHPGQALLFQSPFFLPSRMPIRTIAATTAPATKLTSAAVALFGVSWRNDSTVSSSPAHPPSNNARDNELQCLDHKPRLLQRPILRKQRQRQPRGQKQDSITEAAAAAADPVADDNSNNDNNNTILLTQKFRGCGRLRRNWTQYRTQPVSAWSPVAQAIYKQQQQQRNHFPTANENCDIHNDHHHDSNNAPDTVSQFYMDNDFGLGSHLLLWSQAVCNAAQAGQRIRTVNPAWLWRDHEYCNGNSSSSSSITLQESPWHCYFPGVESSHCEGNNHRKQTTMVNVTDPRNPKLRCQAMQQNDTYKDEFRHSAIEYMFRHVSDLVLQEASRQAALHFGPDGIAPSHMITVHMRWGDKFWEMDLPPVHEYIQAVNEILTAAGSVADQQHQQHQPMTMSPLDAASARQAHPINTTRSLLLSDSHRYANHTMDHAGDSLSSLSSFARPVHIYLSTEDPAAAEAFQRAAPSDWIIYVDCSVTELAGRFRPTRGNRASWTARYTTGRAGLVALGSLLIAMEADYYVLTTQSNWSRVMNAIRLNLIEAHNNDCVLLHHPTLTPSKQSCTRAIDLRRGTW